MPSPLEIALGHTFRDPALLELALTHSSWGHERRKPHAQNERLEFLGDAVLQIVVSRHLYDRDPSMSEGRLSKLRASLVNRNSLARMATTIDLGKYLVLGIKEDQLGGRRRPSNLANALEAVFAALYLDAGLEAAQSCILRLIQTPLDALVDNPEPENAKGILQETLHVSGNTALYRIVSESGPPHQPIFHAVVEIDGEIYGKGSGSTKKESETQAAAEALRKWNR